MRLATLIISLVLMLVLGAQSCAIAVGGSVVEGLSAAGAAQREAEELSGGAALGLLAALLWLVAAALVMGKPKVSMWLFAVAAVVCLLGGTSGFSDLYIWAGASIIFALMSWRGTKEKERKDQEERARYRADVQDAAAAQERQTPI